jgi:hypothetical protein
MEEVVSEKACGIEIVGILRSVEQLIVVDYTTHSIVLDTT